ncbi:DUF6153 family protein [Microbacterium dauci]|uniref:DUF6153 family protein n=1 Tax=Microbacterium dauci TaxID=3048008 RepID=A0ABT6ZD79_9MICO|nr:DUF6153 family protein [Microbacterium sp. LX3-4]MDJ1114109.1 DUF6153 family protein [Microbacterium sp. LX3-4]
MSLIALTDRLRTGRAVARTLLLLIAVTGAVIVGLLAMHSLNAHTATDTGHQATVTTAAAAGAGDHHSGATATDEPCADCGSGHSDMLAMACVLALLATVLLLIRPGAVRRWLSILPRPKPSVIAALTARPALPPPSLTVLCISRT